MRFNYPHVKVNILEGNKKLLKFLANITVQIEPSKKLRPKVSELEER